MKCGLGGAKNMASFSSNARSWGFLADPFTVDLKSFLENIRTHWQSSMVDFGFEDYENVCDWNVYLLYGGRFTHYSLLFKDGNTRSFFIDLVINESKKVDYHFQTFRGSNETLKENYLGTIKKSAAEIHKIGCTILKNMGPYHEWFENCQDYCQKFAEELGVDSVWTGSDMVIAGAAIGMGAAAVLGGLAYWLSSSGKDTKKK